MEQTEEELEKRSRRKRGSTREKKADGRESVKQKGRQEDGQKVCSTQYRDEGEDGQSACSTRYRDEAGRRKTRGDT